MNIERIKEELARTYVKIEKLQKKARDLEEQKKQAEDEDHSVKGKLTVQKKGEVLSTYKNDFRYEVQNLSGAVYEVYAAEDIYTADFQKDDTGKRILKYAKGEKVAELTTDESGKAELDNLPLGEYKVVEKTAPEGFVLNEEEQKISFHSRVL